MNQIQRPYAIIEPNHWPIQQWKNTESTHFIPIIKIGLLFHITFVSCAIAEYQHEPQSLAAFRSYEFNFLVASISFLHFLLSHSLLRSLIFYSQLNAVCKAFCSIVECFMIFNRIYYHRCLSIYAKCKWVTFLSHWKHRIDCKIPWKTMEIRKTTNQRVPHGKSVCMIPHVGKNWNSIEPCVVKESQTMRHLHAIYRWLQFGKCGRRIWLSVFQLHGWIWRKLSIEACPMWFECVCECVAKRPK